MARRIIDISLLVDEGLPTWPGDPAISLRPAASIAAGDPANVSEIRLGSHTGTHVDAPRHFLDEAASVDALDPSEFLGPCHVADLTGVEEEIGHDHLSALALPAGTDRLLLKTRNSGAWARGAPISVERGYVAVGIDGARWLVRRGIRLVGIDHLSIERSPNGIDFPVHRELLAAGVVIVEGLDLSGVEPGPYDLACLPLRLAGCDGAPARAVLIEP